MIEHSSFDSVAGLRRQNDRFERIIDGINWPYLPKLTLCYDISIPFEEIRTGINFDSVCIKLKEWFKNFSETVPSDQTMPVQLQVDGESFHFYVRKTDTPNISGIHFNRIAPPTEPAQILKSIFYKKSDKLRNWKPNASCRRLILLECEDILLKYQKLIEGLRDMSFAKPSWIDEVWLCETTEHHGGVIRVYTNIYTGETYNFDRNLGMSYRKCFRDCYLP